MANDMNIQSFGNRIIDSKSITNKQIISDDRSLTEPKDKVDTSKTSPDAFMNNMKNLQEMKKKQDFESGFRGGLAAALDPVGTFMEINSSSNSGKTIKGNNVTTLAEKFMPKDRDKNITWNQLMSNPLGETNEEKFGNLVGSGVGMIANLMTGFMIPGFAFLYDVIASIGKK
jgi:hypothetical protein